MKIQSYVALSIFISAVLSQYVPEPYGWACYRMAVKRDWPECKSLSQQKQKACLCGLPAFVELTENCLQKAVTNASDPVKAAEYARSVSLCQTASNSNASRIKANFSESTVLKNTTSWSNASGMSYPPGKIKNPSSKAGYLPELNYVDPVSMEEIRLAISTANWRMCNDRRAERSGAALVGFFGVVLIVKLLVHAIIGMLPERLLYSIALWKPIRLFRSRILNPALDGRHHSQPWLKKLGIRFPIRSFSFVIFLFACLNYALIFTNFPYTPDNFIYTSTSQQWNKSLAIRCAFMIMWKLPLVFCFSSRNNVLLLIRHPWSLDTFNVFHKWIARITIVDVIIHGVAISLVKLEQGLYPSIWKVEYWKWGVCGVIAAGFILLQSMHWVSRMNYEVFKVVHIVLAVVFVIATWYHVKVLPYGSKHVYAILAIWTFDHIGRFSRILLAGKVNANIEHQSDTMSVITITRPPAIYCKRFANPAFLYLHLPPFYVLWQSHPFSIVRNFVPKVNSVSSNSDGMVEVSGESSGKQVYNSTSNSSGPSRNSDDFEPVVLSSTSENMLVKSSKYGKNEQLMIAIKHQRGITERLKQLPEGPIGVMLDGPYTNPLPLSRFKQVICLAGGIGITAHLSYIHCLLSHKTKEEIIIKLHWAISNIDEMGWALGVLSDLVAHIEIVIYTTEGTRWRSAIANREWPIDIAYTRLVCSEIVESEIAQINKQENAQKCSTAIFACGPDRFNDDARISACWAIENAATYVDYFEESFSW